MEHTPQEETKRIAPGVCFPREEKVTEFGEIKGDPELIKKQWESIDVAAYMYLWYWVHR